MSDSISYKPTDGLSYDPEEPRYWDEAALAKEVERVFEICHGCRMCWKYCDSFPRLFQMVDERDGQVRGLGGVETAHVMDACFQCKLCEVQCPYTPRDKHEFQLDFPKLVHRWKAVRARKDGVSLRDRALGDPDKAGAAARATLGLANQMNRVRLHRVLMERALGIHRDKLLPLFADETFTDWAEAQGLAKDAPGGEVALFATCYVEHNEPQIGRDTVAVLTHNQVDVRVPRALVCCGMPAWESGDLATLRIRARKNLEVLAPFVERGAKVVAVNPTCSMMLRREYPTLVPAAEREVAEKVAAAVRDPGELLWAMRNEPRFASDFKSHPESVAYHAPCHLRAQGVGFKGRDLIRRTGVTQLSSTLECCGHDGTYGMKVESFEASRRIGQKAFDGLKGAEAATWVTECPLAALQFEQHAGRKPLHPMSLLARAYRGDPFPAPAAAAPAKPSTKE